jgi:pyruvate ferredoxin oxidoreductase alpha subunit
MPMESKTAESVELCSGNKAAAYGALLSRPDVVAIYPITPQTAIAEWISRFNAQGALEAEIVEVEGENSAMGVVCSASAAGGRVFTATSSWGLAFMTDGLHFAAARRLPVVMVNVNRETPGLPTIGCGRQDMMSCRDTGWIQIEVETCQEILDTVLMAYKIAEDPGILLPVMISYDGFYLSHLEERVVVPSRERVARLHEGATKPERMVLRAEEPRAFGGGFGPESCTEFRYRHSHALRRLRSGIVHGVPLPAQPCAGQSPREAR